MSISRNRPAGEVRRAPEPVRAPPGELGLGRPAPALRTRSQAERRQDDRRRSGEDRRFWSAWARERRVSDRRAALPDRRTPEASAVLAEAELGERRRRLKAMLDKAEQRHKRGSDRRAGRPVFAEGVAVRIVAGSEAGTTGTLLDADHIHARALIAIDGRSESEPAWVGFADLMARGTA